MKLAEAGLDHRYEMKGALHGLFRVREFTQDDAHLFIRPDQITEQVTDASHLITAYYAQFGFPYRVELSTRPEDSMGSDFKLFPGILIFVNGAENRDDFFVCRQRNRPPAVPRQMHGSHCRSHRPEYRRP